MHSSHPSRGRILFEVFCALVISASCVGAWMQTGALAFLPASFVTLLYGVVRAFDMAGRKTAATVEPQRIDFTTDDQAGLSACQVDGVPPAGADRPLASDSIAEDTKPVEPTTPQAGKSRRAKSSRKSRTRVASAEEEVTEAARADEAEDVMPDPHEESEYHSLSPLFEPEPFARQRHAVFGRKAG